MEKVVIISGANIQNGGPLEIFKSIAAFWKGKQPEYKIYLVVRNKALFDLDGIEYIEIPDYRKHIHSKFYYEYFHYKKISEQLKPFIWISLNDLTPTVHANYQFTYFHNASVFHKIRWKDFFFNDAIVFQKIYYSFFVHLNKKRLTSFIVQQEWIAKALKEKLHLPDNKFIVKASPNTNVDISNGDIVLKNESFFQEHHVYFYPARPSTYKNYECVFDAFIELHSKNVKHAYIAVTISGNENRYARFLKGKYANAPILWLGSIPRLHVERYYQLSKGLVFPSRLETWGLPLSEYQNFGKPIFAADLPYARETLKGYQKSYFFHPDKPQEIAEHIIKTQNALQHITPVSNNKEHQRESDWDFLFSLIS